MSVQGFKNLMKITLFSDDSFQPLLKKNQEYRKITQLSIDHFQSIARNYQGFQAAYHRILQDYDHQTQVGEIVVPQYYHQYIQLYRNIHSQQKFFCEKLSNNFKELTSLCNNIFNNYSNLILTFQGLIRSYKSHEQILFELSKKYFRTHKTMISNIESYKNSFTDVKLIYNMDEKNKRFNACQGTYKNLMEELQAIEEKLKLVNEEKQQITDSYVQIESEFKITLKTIGNKIIAMAKLFMHDYCIMQKTMITYLAEKKFTLEKIELKTFFNTYTKIKEEDYFSVAVDRSKCQFLPSFIVYAKEIKEEAYQNTGKFIAAYIKELEGKIEQRMILNRKVLEFTVNFVKNYEKSYYLNLKEIMGNYQKMKKKLTEIFGGRLASFLKSNNAVFDISIGINEKLLKRTPAKLKQVQAYLVQEGKTLEIFMKELRSNLDKFLKKKEVKKILEGTHEDNQFTEDESSNVDLTAFKQQFTSICDYLTHLIQGFVDKIKKLQDQVKFQYNAFVNDLSVSTNEIFSLCCDYQQLYFGQADFATNYKKYELDIDKTLENESKFFEDINFGILKKEECLKIVFDSDIGKVEEYKKLKKPMEIEIEEEKKKEEGNLEVGKKKDSVSEVDGELPERKNSNDNKSATKEVINPSPEKPEKGEKIDKAQKQNRQREQFLRTKIVFLPDQKFYKTFSCGLSDKIILTGRLYITNKRLCFHSKFNPSNVFFGQTFMQIPRKDIKKIEKRYNAIVFDNSISITTIHGQVFLTSFFSRNEAFDLICSALDINADEVMYQPEEIKEDAVVEAAIIAEDDDIKEADVPARQQSVEKLLSVFDYKKLFHCQFVFPGLNALKFFKLFELNQEVNFNRKVYKNWSHYMKEILEHKDYEIGQWSPLVTDYLNSGNIKSSTPLSFTKKVNCMVPISNSGVPFMPKFAKSEQKITLLFYSKDKYIIESTIQNSGVPYSDTFSLKLKKVFETNGQGRCTMTAYLYLNFVTSTMMKSIIQSKSAEETKVSFGKFQEEVNRYLKHLNKMRMKQLSNNDSSGGQKQLNSNVLNEQYQKEISQLKESQDKLKSELKADKTRIQQGKKILLASLILNILLILILIA